MIGMKEYWDERMAALITTSPFSSVTSLLLRRRRVSPPKPLLFFSPSNKPGASPPIHRAGIFLQRSPPLLRISAAEPGDASPSVEDAQQIVSSTSTDGDLASTIVSSLLFIAFVGLSILTIGVVYLGVTDFLQKREREKFEKEEAAKKKKGGKKKKVKVRAGPRGFGQKIVEQDDEVAD